MLPVRSFFARSASVRPWSRFGRDQKGTVAIISAIALPVLLGLTGLVAEMGHGLLSKAENQRVADMAAYAGALAYNATSSTTSMTNAAKSVAALNGIPASAVTATLTTSPRTASSQAVFVNIATSNLVLLAPVTQTNSVLSIGAKSYAQISAGTPACVLALSTSGTGVTLSGGTSISAAQCAVASNNTVTVPCGTTITAKTLAYFSVAAPSQPCSGITANAITKVQTSDPYATNSGITTATGRISTAAAVASPAAPSAPTSTTDLAFGWSSSSMTVGSCSGTQSSNTWTFTCPSGGTYNFRSLTVAGGLALLFNTGGSSSTTYNFSGSINTSSANDITFGPGVYNIAQGLTTGGGNKTTFGAGTFNIGQSLSACSGGGTYSICNLSSGATSLGGSGSNSSIFSLRAGIYNGGGSTLTLGTGSANTFQVGKSSDGNALYTGGGSKTTFADATTGATSFQFNGNFANGGGSCTTLSAAAQHDINGNLSAMGGTILGSGVYTINGYFALGESSGGTVTCNGATVGLTGTSVTLVISGVNTSTASACSGLSFCIAGGFSSVALTAPTSNTAPTQGFAVIGPTVTSRTSGVLLGQGASGASISGVFYYPNGPVSLSGGASIGNGSGQCLQLIGTQITLSGGTTAASSCVTAGSSSGGASSVSLVQ